MDCTQFVKTCDKCQRFVKAPYKSLKLLHYSEMSQPFHRLGIKLLGPFLLALGQLKHLVVTIDYFTKVDKSQAILLLICQKDQEVHLEKDHL